jgi:o-succinylbenzoate---CoA ligase
MNILERLKNYDQNKLTIYNQPQNLLTITEKYLKQFKQKQAKIIIAETDPLNFLGAFCASLIKQYLIFLANPNWQQREWDQVLNLVKPHLIIKNNRLISHSPEINYHSDNSNFQIMIPTGGSSGKIRFSMHNWETLSASVRGFSEYFALKKIHSFCLLPLYHVSGLMQFLRCFITGGNLVIFPYKALKTEKMIDLNLEGFFTSLVPTQLQFLLQSNRGAWLSQFQTILLGGAPAWPTILEEARQKNLPLSPTYGMTETASQIVTLKPHDFLKGNNSSGQVLPHAKVKIFNAQGEELGINQKGIIHLKTTSLCQGYYPQKFASNSYYNTDDLGYFDPEGYLYIIGRNSRKIITGGENVFPSEIEAAIFATKLVEDVCVIGISDPQWGEIVAAVYVSQIPDLSEDLINQKIANQISNFKLPKLWFKVESLPRNTQGKIDQQKLLMICESMLKNGDPKLTDVTENQEKEENLTNFP